MANSFLMNVLKPLTTIFKKTVNDKQSNSKSNVSSSFIAPTVNKMKLTDYVSTQKNKTNTNPTGILYDKSIRIFELCRKIIYFFNI